MAAGDSIEINGKTYRLRPIVVQHLLDLERAALAYYKRQYMETFQANADLLGEDAEKIVQRELMKVARWDLSDVPRKDSYDAVLCPVTEELKKWLETNVGEVPADDDSIRFVVTSLLDQGAVSADEIQEMTGRRPLVDKVRYDQWWITGTAAGKMSFILSSIRHEHPEVDESVVAAWTFVQLNEASRKVDALTVASLGNG